MVGVLIDIVFGNRTSIEIICFTSILKIKTLFFSKEPRFLERRSIWEMETVSHHMWNEYAQLFYPDGTKEVPSDILLEQWLTPRAIAYWYMDDGAIANPNRKATSLNYHGFSLEDNSRLVRFLQKKYGLNTWIKFNKKRPMIMISGHSKMSELVLPFIIPSMHYKFPGPRLRSKPS
uniref:Putative LAGLIDADG endonuclease n=1 Tax=Ostreobium quekettii TaxID=121088 RepID=A0A650BXQ7_9CHLO|nr:putative LAGLIDADG endonuclease [Ostreobium quekettii]QGQ61989.1 putative LAGLIDADG endonuclease [Ostreobium quekettii]